MLLRSVKPTELARGQAVIVFARWLLVLVGLLAAIWNPDPLPQLRIQIGVILLVAIANFVMHAQLLRRRPTIMRVAQAASLGDLLVITLLIASQGGFSSTLFIFYFPAVLAIAIAFPTRQAGSHPDSHGWSWAQASGSTACWFSWPASTVRVQPRRWSSDW